MGVGENELAAGRGLAEAHPTADTGEGGVPGFAAGNLGCFREPEVAVGDGGEARFAVGDEGPLAFAFAVVAGHAGESVVGESCGDGVVLDGEDFLEADEIGAEGFDRIEEKFSALGPGVGAVGLGGVADVERHHAQRFGGVGGGGGEDEKGEGAEKRGHEGICKRDGAMAMSLQDFAPGHARWFALAGDLST